MLTLIAERKAREAKERAAASAAVGGGADQEPARLLLVVAVARCDMRIVNVSTAAEKIAIQHVTVGPGGKPVTGVRTRNVRCANGSFACVHSFRSHLDPSMLS